MNRDVFNQLMGWDFVLIAAVFALGLTKTFARRFYPALPSLKHRLAAPIIFSTLAAACFAGFGFWALTRVATLGLALMIVTRWRRRNGAA
jgi:hypothetical protein